MHYPFGRGRHARIVPWVGLIPAAALYLAFGVFPSVMTAYYSLTSYNGIEGSPIRFIGLENYRLALSAGLANVVPAVEVTVIFALAVTLIQNGAGLALAIAMNRRVMGVSFYRAVIFFPEVLSVVVIGVIWTLVFSPTGGPAEPVWTAITGHPSSFLGSFHMALPIVIFVQVWTYTGFSMLIYLAGLQSVPLELYDTAKVDGAGRWDIFRHVTWPMLASSTTVNVFLSIIGAIGEYSLIFVLTDGEFGTQTLGMYMFNVSFSPNLGMNELGYGSMLMILQFVLTLLIAIPLQWYLRRQEVQL